MLAVFNYTLLWPMVAFNKPAPVNASTGGCIYGLAALNRAFESLAAFYNEMILGPGYSTGQKSNDFDSFKEIYQSLSRKDTDPLQLFSQGIELYLHRDTRTDTLSHSQIEPAGEVPQRSGISH